MARTPRSSKYSPLNTAAKHGRHAGVVRGGAGRRMTPVLQPGAQLSLEWRARLEEHLGAFRVEPVRSRAAAMMSDRRALAAMGSVAALITAYLPEREAHPTLYAQTVHLLDAMGEAPDWPHLYAEWELALLGELGFGLDLTECAATGRREELVYVSPRSGAAVSREAGTPYREKLLTLPGFLIGQPGGTMDEALRLTGYFLQHRAAAAFNKAAPPAARGRLADMFHDGRKDDGENSDDL
jgi:DNA repair protein RecO (recombination protein O)